MNDNREYKTPNYLKISNSSQDNSNFYMTNPSNFIQTSDMDLNLGKINTGYVPSNTVDFTRTQNRFNSNNLSDQKSSEFRRSMGSLVNTHSDKKDDSNMYNKNTASPMTKDLKDRHFSKSP